MDSLKTLIFGLADDELLMGHRASEWTGLGPLLEADLALSSIAQDEMGHALLLYGLLEPLGEPEADALVFYRGAAGWRNAILCELPRQDWGETLVRHFLYDLAEQIRLEALADSSHEGLRGVARKIRGEERYHLVHGTTWLRRLVQGTPESRARVQGYLDALLPYALGLWEPLPGEAELDAAGVIPPMGTLGDRWWVALEGALGDGFALPAREALQAVTGGRRGAHTEHLTTLLDVMQRLHRELPGTKW